MAKIYISSTYLDLKDYRAMAIETVKEMGHEPVCMEDYGACENPPVKKCLKDVLECDGYLGIVAWRYGFVPEGYGGMSITHLEYDTAGRKGIGRLIFLALENTPDFEESKEKGKGGRKVKKFRKKLKKKHTVGLFRDKKTFQEFVQRSIELEFGKIEQIADDGEDEERKTDDGWVLPFLCDRDGQHTKFWNFFKENIKKDYRKPQFVFIQGDIQECPDSFVTRIVEKSLTQFAERELKGNKVICKDNEIEWPDSSNLDDCKECVTQKLLNHFLPGSVHDLTGGAQLCDLLDLSKHPIVVVSHTISTSMWNRNSRRFLEWYIQDFWNNCDWGGERPLFFVFFKIQYCEQGNGRKTFLFSRKKSDKENIQEDLRELAGELGDSCSLLLLDELGPVSMDHVLDWMRSYRYYKNDVKRRSKAKNLLEKVSCRDLNQIRMCLAEDVLEQIVAEHQSRKADSILRS